MADVSATNSTQGVRPPPLGVVPNFQNPENQNARNIALHTIMLSFVTIAIVIRFYNRAFVLKKIALDDYFCAVAYLLAIGYSALFLAAMSIGFLGYHIWDITPSTFFRGHKIELGCQSMYLPLAAFIKLSVLATYRHIFEPKRHIRYLCYGGMAFISAGYLSFFFVFVAISIPTAKRNNANVSSTWLPSSVTSYGSGALNVVTDIFVVVLPMPVLGRLNMKRVKKVKTMAIFGLGILAVGLATVRLAFTKQVFNHYDATWELSRFSIYSILELYIGLICSCVLTSTSFIDHYGSVIVIKMKTLKGHTRSNEQPNVERDFPEHEHHVTTNSKPPRQIIVRASDESLDLAQDLERYTNRPLLIGSATLPLPPALSVPAPYLSRPNNIV